MDSSQQLGQLLQSLADKAPDALDNDARALLADAAARYPYFAVPALALLRDGRTPRRRSAHSPSPHTATNGATSTLPQPSRSPRTPPT